MASSSMHLRLANKASSRSLLLRRHLHYLQLPLAPLLNVHTGEEAVDFPATLLHYHLLTEAQLDELAHFYHQRTPSDWNYAYPAPIFGKWPGANIADKKRRFGRFIGLRDCESPTLPQTSTQDEQMIQEWFEKLNRTWMDEDAKWEIWLKKRL